MNNEENSYINLHTVGTGELRRVREIQTRGGKSYYAVDAHLFSGGDRLRKRYFQLNVTGRNAKEALPELEEAINDRNRTVEANLWIGDAESRSYSNKDGEIRHSIFGRLLGIENVTINGNPVSQQA